MTETRDAGAAPPRRRRRIVVAGAVVVLLAAAGVLDLGHPFGASPTHPFGDQPAAAAAPSNASATATAPVTRRDLAEQTSVDATLGYARSYTVTNLLTAAGSGTTNAGSAGGSGASGAAASQPASGNGAGQGVATWLPTPGRVVDQGQVLYRVDGQPVVLLYGSTPAYRTLAEGSTSGRDVRQLNADLVALGYASRADLDPHSNEFGWATKAAVEKLQQHLGIAQTGALRLGQVAFLPTAIRVTSVAATLGSPVGTATPVLTGTSTRRQVRIDLDTSEQSDVKVGDRVSITLPNNRTTPGVVTGVGTVASSSSGQGADSSSDASSTSSASGSSSGSGSSTGSADSTVAVYVRLIHPAAAHTWDQAPVQVTITTDTAHDVLTVPVVALLAQPGGYAVEVVAGDGTHRLVPVSLGLFDDAHGLVQVTGSGLKAGQRVAVPKL